MRECRKDALSSSVTLPSSATIRPSFVRANGFTSTSVASSETKTFHNAEATAFTSVAISGGNTAAASKDEAGIRVMESAISSISTPPVADAMPMNVLLARSSRNDR
ncbi:hypothetical protein LX86_004274 [Lentzea aerocolonigenes]|nr:hypothetical protein [Lentzea aerocolonigenes]